jgi:hypothetical protein
VHDLAVVVWLTTGIEVVQRREAVRHGEYSLVTLKVWESFKVSARQQGLKSSVDMMLINGGLNNVSVFVDVTWLFECLDRYLGWIRCRKATPSTT